MNTPGQLDMLAALERVEANARAEWLKAAEQAVLILARTGQPFTTEDCKPLVTAETHEPRAWGAVIRKFAVAGVIQKTNQLVEATDRRCHARPMTQWCGTSKAVAA